MVTHEDDIAEHAKRVIRMRDGLIIDDRPSPRMQQKLQNGAVGPHRPSTAPTAQLGRSDCGARRAELDGPSEELTH